MFMCARAHVHEGVGCAGVYIRVCGVGMRGVCMCACECRSLDCEFQVSWPLPGG